MNASHVSALCKLYCMIVKKTILYLPIYSMIFKTSNFDSIISDGHTTDRLWSVS